MNKYKFENGYVAEWRNQAINPDSYNQFDIQWTPDTPDMFKCGNQFAGEYIYKFVPMLCQPIANRTKRPLPYTIAMPGYVLCILFMPNERPKYLAGGKEFLVTPASKMDDNSSHYFSKN